MTPALSQLIAGEGHHRQSRLARRPKAKNKPSLIGVKASDRCQELSAGQPKRAEGFAECCAFVNRLITRGPGGSAVGDLNTIKPMKLFCLKREQGNTLVLTLVVALTVGAVLASYLALIGSRYKLTVRSQCWNAAVPVLEAGIEEALTHMQDDLNNPGANGWSAATVSGQLVYAKQRTFADGSYYLVNIYNAAAGASNTPYIYSTGFVPSPVNTTRYISRTARVTGTNEPLFDFAFAAISTIQMNGNGIAADSFNSSNPALSTNGQYDPAKVSTNGNVASVYGPVDFGNHNIEGSLYLGPTASSTVPSSQVSGSIYTDFNASFPDVILPTTTWLAASAGTTGGLSLLGLTLGGSSGYDFVTSGDYYVTDSSNIQVEPGVTVRLRVDTTSFNPSSIHVVSSNGVSGTLILYQVAGTAAMSGSVTVDSGHARNLYYYGLPGVTSITYGGSSSFVGALYAPEANLTLNGGGSNNGLIGSSVTKSIIAMNGHYDFHFDEDLLSAGPSRGYVVTSWKEL
jgi:hypothetical protein